MKSAGPVHAVCKHCRAQSAFSLAQMLAALQRAGKLRRAADPGEDFVRELFRGVLGQLTCEACGDRGLAEVFPAAVGEDWPAEICCEVCGKVIPPERLEVLGDIRLCLACQAADERGGSSGTPEYCVRCGAQLVVRQDASRGITRFVLACPECKR